MSKKQTVSLASLFEAERERDELRAENDEMLTKIVESLDERDELRTENERLQRQVDAARMIIGPLSKRPDLLDAADDVVRKVERLRQELEDILWMTDAEPQNIAEVIRAALDRSKCR
jgi:predicted nuclease with TOPRIM domain